MFEVNGQYANRNGTYTVLELFPTKMKVRYENGEVAELNIKIQERIWQNIKADIEAQQRKANRLRSSGPKGRFIVRSVSLAEMEDQSPQAIRERMAQVGQNLPNIAPGDRFIFYALEDRTFFGVATVTGTPVEPSSKTVLYDIAEDGPIMVIPLDWDAQVTLVENGVSLDTAELESQPDFKRKVTGAGYLEISEDDFELIAELIAETAEDEEGDDDEDEDIADDEDELEDE